MDADGDGFLAPPAGPGAPVDCNDSDSFTNPGRLEDLGSERDDNCNQRRGMVPMFGESNFSPTKWTDLGTVSRGIDTITVGVASSGAAASSTRTVAVPLPVSVVVSVKVVVDSGASALPCSVRLGTTLGSPPGALSWAAQPIVGLGAQLLNFVGVIAPGRTLRKVEISCIGSHSVGVDWLQVQDASVVFGPMNEAAVDWQDVRHPVNDASIGLVRDNGKGEVWLGTDSSGVALMDSTGWHVQNGWGSRSLIAGGVIGVTDILPMEDGSEEAFALTGDVGATGPVGGLWRSPDDGENWDQIGSSIRVWPPAAWGTTDDTYLDDVAAYQLESNCPGNHDGRQWQWGGGHHLVGQSVHPIAGEPVYIANGDSDNLGVSVYDVANDIVCPMATTGDALPADRIGALLRVDALPYGTPTLVVGYRGRNDLGASVYVCELPTGGVDCTGATSADCQVVDVDPSGLGAWDLSGVDVRDLEEDTWLTGEGQIIDQVGVLIADGGSRPGGGDADADGVADNVCDGHGSAIHELLIDDAAGYLTVDVDAELATEVDFRQVLAGVGGLTGISLDPLSQYVFANIPATESAAYRHDRLYRVPAADLLGGAPIPLWEAVNSGDEDPATATAYNVADPYEQTRMTYDLDLSGAWLEAVIHGQPTVFPARAAPGFGWDIAWLWSFTFGAVGTPPSFGVESLAAIPNAGMVWAVSGLNGPWIDNEPNETVHDGVTQAENDVRFKFWPTIDVSRKETFQGVRTAEVAIARDGHIWSANGDQAIGHSGESTGHRGGTDDRQRGKLEVFGGGVFDGVGGGVLSDRGHEARR